MVQGLIYGAVILIALAYFLLTDFPADAGAGRPLVPIGFYVVTLFVLIYSVVVFVSRLQRVARARRWPQANGVIEEVEARRSGWRLSYAYRVNDTPYHNDVYDNEFPLARPVLLALRFKRPLITPKELLDRRVSVYFDPLEPARSVLSRSGQPSPWLLLLPALVSLSTSCIMIFLLLSPRL